MASQKPDPPRFADKTEAVESLIKNTFPRQLLLTRPAIAYAKPWGEKTMREVTARSTTLKNKRAVPAEGTDPDELVIGTYVLIKILVEAEGRQPINAHPAGSGRLAEVNYKKNLPLLVDEVDDVSPRDIETDWRKHLRGERSGLEIEGLHDNVD